MTNDPLLNGSPSEGVLLTAENGKKPNASSPRKTVTITAVEDDDEDIIPGPPPNLQSAKGDAKDKASTSTGSSGKRRLVSRILTSSGKGARRSVRKNSSSSHDELQLSVTEHWAGQGILASRADLEIPAEEFAAGCNLLQAAAIGDQPAMQKLLTLRPQHVNFRDYDRRTALHVAASEGHLHICRYLVEEKGANINRSDRWGGSPLDDAHRHRHARVIAYLREKGATTGSGNRTTNLITAAADGDTDEVRTLVKLSTDSSKDKMDVNKGDYDKRTALHLAAGE